MKITKTSVDDLNVVVAITIEKQDYEATINETLKDYRKKANMPGFRKGMVPAGLIKKMYGKAALGEEVNKILSLFYHCISFVNNNSSKWIHAHTHKSRFISG